MTQSHSRASGRARLPRRVQPELLDTLPADDPQAVRSRQDLRRVNWLMGNAAVLRRALDGIIDAETSPHLVELGAGDGSLMQALARRRGTRWRDARVTLIDRQPCVGATTLHAIRNSGWQVEVAASDVFDWLAQAQTSPNAIVIANLFMHHFAPTELARLMRAIAQHAGAFVCCEPRRSRVALAGSHLLGLLGCNAITRHDAVVSVHAGFSDHELTTMWPAPMANGSQWQLTETSAGLFGHRFVAIRTP